MAIHVGMVTGLLLVWRATILDLVYFLGVNQNEKEGELWPVRQLKHTDAIRIGCKGILVHMALSEDRRVKGWGLSHGGPSMFSVVLTEAVKSSHLAFVQSQPWL